MQLGGAAIELSTTGDKVREMLRPCGGRGDALRACAACDARTDGEAEPCERAIGCASEGAIASVIIQHAEVCGREAAGTRPSVV